MQTYFRTLALVLLLVPASAWSQKKAATPAPTPVAPKTETKKHYLDDVSLGGLKFRAVGPALTSGRVVDFAVHPQRKSTYYVAVACGGVWKTINNGTTFEPIFDQQPSFSVGCLALDPQNPNVLWVGTGENNNQRSVAYGDGVYKSEDGGKSFKNMGLKNSEHIGKIVIDPTNSDVVYVAALGPLWAPGGERGVYKTTDGGKTWNLVLNIDEHTGVNDIIMDPRNPNLLYASTHQRRRHVFTYVSGGPGSTIYRSKDAGKSWEKAENGLPSVDKGRIGLAISPANPEYLYAIVEAAQGQGGFYRSMDRGASWEKRSGHSTSGNYYCEIVPHPQNPDIIYSVDTYFQWSEDGGKTFKILGEQYKHVDNHCIWIDPSDATHYLVGCDGGIYESFDAAKTWNYKSNLSITQFYKVEVDNSKPFYYIYGGTQDNFSLGGPSRTRSANGITNADWFVTQGGDGFESQIDPDNPNIVYAQSQYGGLTRYDRASGENLGIQPQPAKGEASFRWNWDAPLATSKHKPGRLYFAANKLFRSDDRGSSWTTISPDLSRQIDRNTLEVMGKVQSIDAVAKNESASQYGNITAFAESPKNAEVLYVGTDDGLIQVSMNGGQTWTKVDVDQLPGAPKRTFVNHIFASNHDQNTAYACLNHHKYGDFKPYVYRTQDGGKSWTNIANNLPERGTAYCLVEDHMDRDLLFVGTEFSCYVSVDAGKFWKKLNAGLPPISIKDMAIQQRENDLVLATFGRGFYVLDDYSPLRQLKEEQLSAEAKIFPVKDALLFVESMPLGVRGNGFMGHNYFSTPNPAVGATFTYFVKEAYKTKLDQRREMEKEKLKKSEAIRYPTLEELEAEGKEEAPYLLFSIKDQAGNVIRNLKTGLSKGVQRIVWDGRLPSVRPTNLASSSFDNVFESPDRGIMALPGTYTVSLSRSTNGELKEVGAPQTFMLKTLGGETLPAGDRNALVNFQKEAQELQRQVSGAGNMLGELRNKAQHMRQAILATPALPNGLIQDLQKIERKIDELSANLYGNRYASRVDKDLPPGPASRLGQVAYEMSESTSTPSQSHRDAIKMATEECKPIMQALQGLANGPIKELEQKLELAKAPYTPGRTGN